MPDAPPPSRTGVAQRPCLLRHRMVTRREIPPPALNPKDLRCMVKCCADALLIEGRPLCLPHRRLSLLDRRLLLLRRRLLLLRRRLSLLGRRLSLLRRSLSLLGRSPSLLARSLSLLNGRLRYLARRLSLLPLRRSLRASTPSRRTFSEYSDLDVDRGFGEWEPAATLREVVRRDFEGSAGRPLGRPAVP